jgi:hypothetical protein
VPKRILARQRADQEIDQVLNEVIPVVGRDTGGGNPPDEIADPAGGLVRELSLKETPLFGEQPQDRIERQLPHPLTLAPRNTA